MITLPLIFGDVAGSEILLILVFVLIFFGSKSIPGMARTLGRTIRQIKEASNEVQNEIRKSTGDMRKDFDLQRMLNETAEEVERPLREQARTLDQAMNFEPPAQFVQPSAQKPAEQSPENSASPDMADAAVNSVPGEKAQPSEERKPE